MLITVQFQWQVYDLSCGKQRRSCGVVVSMVASCTIHICFEKTLEVDVINTKYDV